jgi:hypothetical protein
MAEQGEWEERLVEEDFRNAVRALERTSVVAAVERLVRGPEEPIGFGVFAVNLCVVDGGRRNFADLVPAYGRLGVCDGIGCRPLHGVCSAAAGLRIAAKSERNEEG